MDGRTGYTDGMTEREPAGGALVRAFRPNEGRIRCYVDGIVMELGQLGESR
jgi:hypothetical protein